MSGSREVAVERIAFYMSYIKMRDHDVDDILTECYGGLVDRGVVISVLPSTEGWLPVVTVRANPRSTERIVEVGWPSGGM
jgi:hypothetical protein